MLVQMHPMWRVDAPASARVLKVLEKAPTEFTGLVMVDQKGYSWVTDPCEFLLLLC